MDLNTSERARAPEPVPARQNDSSAVVGRAPTQIPALSEKPLIWIRSSAAGVRLDLRELWAYHELLFFLTWRDIKVRYKQTLMGAAWVIIQPLVTMLVFTVFFNRLGGFRSDGIHYPLFAYAGLLLWMFVASAVTSGTYSLVNNANLITKVYFPRMFIPAAAVGAGLVDLAFAAVILVGLAGYYGVRPTWGLLLLPVFILLTVVLALGVGLLVSALTVRYRDLRHALPFLIQLWMFASPVIYPASIVPERWRWALALNPLTGIIEGFRAALVGRPFPWSMISVSAILSLALLVVSLYVFRRVEETFADVI